MKMRGQRQCKMQFFGFSFAWQDPISAFITNIANRTLSQTAANPDPPAPAKPDNAKPTAGNPGHYPSPAKPDNSRKTPLTTYPQSTLRAPGPHHSSPQKSLRIAVNPVCQSSMTILRHPRPFSPPSKAWFMSRFTDLTCLRIRKTSGFLGTACLAPISANPTYLHIINILIIMCIYNRFHVRIPIIVRSRGLLATPYVAVRTLPTHCESGSRRTLCIGPH